MPDVPPRDLTPVSPAESSPMQAAFCPHGGKVDDATGRFDVEFHALLRSRLRTVAIIGACGFAAFLVRNIALGYQKPPNQLTFIFHLGVTVVLAVSAWLLSSKCSVCLSKLQVLELVIFGLPALFFIWVKHAVVAAADQMGDEARVAAAFPSSTVIPWLHFITMYGIFIPNTAKRAIAVISVMALMPLIGAALIATKHAEVHSVLFGEGGFSSMLIGVCMASVIAVYGAHRFGRLRRDAFDARKLGTYQLKQKLGKGGMGEVYLAEHHLLKRPCAIKLIRGDKAESENALARFESEVQATAKLTHPNTVEIFDYGHTQEGTFFYVMEYLPGLDLQEMVERYGALPPERVLYLLLQVCSALREAHSMGVVHRDVKPGNIFAAERGGLHDVAKLLDFGLVKQTRVEPNDVQVTMDGVVVGSPLFAAPELTVDGNIDARSDVYSIGATAFYLLTGRPVFKGDNPMRIIMSHANDEPPLPSVYRPGVPADLERIVLKCLEKDPASRYQNMAELLSALRSCDNSRDWNSDHAAAWWSRMKDAPREVAVDDESSQYAATAMMPTTAGDEAAAKAEQVV